jgi:hypothetical protein
MLGSLAMSALGNRWPAFRHWFAWTAAGTIVGAALGSFWGAEPGWFAMTVTGALCARLARCWVRWGPDERRYRNARTPAVAINACPPK